MCFNCLQYGCYKHECENPDPQKQGGGMPVVTATMLIMRAIILTTTSKSLIYLCGSFVPTSPQGTLSRMHLC
jgi:hypothetical protein